MTLTLHWEGLVDAALYPRPLPARMHYPDEPRAADGHRHEYDNRTLLCYRCKRTPPLRVWRLDKATRAYRQWQRTALTAALEADYPATVDLEGEGTWR